MEVKSEHEADESRQGGGRGGVRARRDGRVHHPDHGRRGRARIRVGDSVIGFNFRPDRMRQITEALTKAGVDRYVTLTAYEEGWPYPVAFLPDRPEVTLAKVISQRGETRLAVSETEKYPHVTYFFNGGEEAPYPGEVREPSTPPATSPPTNHEPEMSARAATDAFVRHWSAGPSRSSGSSTSPTATWSATPGCWRRRCRRRSEIVEPSACGREIEVVDAGGAAS